MNKDDKTRLLLFAAGVSIGAAIGLLYAPLPGTETRRRIASTAQTGREVYEMGRHLAEDAADMMEEGRRLVKG